MSAGDASPIYQLLPTEQLELVNQFCDRFEQAWQAGTAPSIEAHLASAPEAIRQVLLHELVLVDATYRNKAGAPIDLSGSYGHLNGLDQHWLTKNLPTLAGMQAGHNLVDEIPELTRYEIAAEVGRGGMGVVYRARDRRLGRDVCLKSLHASAGKQPDRLTRFRREARVIGSLNHPNICTLHELEEQDDRPYLVLEWIEGKTLRELANEGCDPSRLPRFIPQIGRALEAAHAAGIVHRDIKPENLIVRPDGVVKVLDFGLARLHEPGIGNLEPTENLTAEGAFLGTAKYMSPEQARGEPATAASDIFSLGIVLYELATGSHPFPASYLAAVLSSIVEVDLRAAISQNTSLDPRLASLLSRMLEKRPADRPTAAEVAASFATADQDASLGLGLIEADNASSHVIVGRDTELRELAEACTAAGEGRGGAVFVSGDPGIGKTTLLEAAADRLARRQGYIVLHGRCSQRLSSSDPYLPVLDALSRSLHGPDGVFIKQSLEANAPAWQALIASSTDALSRLATETGQLSQARMKREFRALLEDLSQSQPVLLLIDDLHWSDEQTTDLLGYLGQGLPTGRVLVLGGHRARESSLENEPFDELRRDFVTRGWAREVALPLLARDEIATFLDRRFPVNAFSDSFVDFLCSRTEGSPLFLQGLVRHLQDRGIIVQEGGRWQTDRNPSMAGGDLPETITSLIETTLRRLDIADRRLLQAASVRGAEFEDAVIADALGLDRVEAEDRLQAIESGHGLVRVAGERELGDGTLTLRYRFTHILFQETLYAEVNPARRAKWSKGIGDVLTTLSGNRTKEISSELAFLFESGRDYSNAIKWLLQSARHQIMIGANREAADACSRGLRLLEKLSATSERDQIELKLQFTRGFAETYVHGYGSDQALVAYHRAEELCASQPPAQEHFSVLHGLWVYHSARMDAAHVAALEERILRLADRLQSPCYCYAANTTIVLSLMHRGELTLADKHLRLAADSGEYSVDDDRRFIEQMCMPFGPAFHTARSWLRQLQGREEEALAETAAAVAWEAELGVPQFQVSSWYATLYYLQGNASLALRWARESIEYARRADFDLYLDMANIIEAWAATVGADNEPLRSEAIDEAILRVRPDHQSDASRFGDPLQMCMLGEALASLDRHDQALDAFTSALTLSRESNVRWWEAEILRQLGLLSERAFGDHDEAKAKFNEGLEVARSQGAVLLLGRCQDDLTRLEVES